MQRRRQQHNPFKNLEEVMHKKKAHSKSEAKRHEAMAGHKANESKKHKESESKGMKKAMKKKGCM